MKTRQVTPNLIQVSRGGFVNAFLVREEDGLTLVDTMLPRGAAGILAAAEAAGAPVVRIALTHAHGDHVGSVDELAQRLPGVELSISARDARFIRGDKSLDPDEQAKGKLRGSWRKLETAPARTLEAGDRVGSLEVVGSPGHTPGHVSFIDTRDRSLLAGDAFSTLGGVSVPSWPNPRFPLPALATWHRPTALASAVALRALAPTRLAVGHGRTVEDPLAAMDRALDRAGSRAGVA